MTTNLSTECSKAGKFGSAYAPKASTIESNPPTTSDNKKDPFVQHARAHFLVLLALGSGACAGGQSGTEGDPSLDPCADKTRTPVGLDDQTAAGTARTAFDAVTAPESASLRWFSHGDGTNSDTTATFTVTGTPGAATWVVPSEPSCSPEVEIEAALRIESADGAFDDVFSGFVYRRPSGESGFRGQLPVGEFMGGYDMSTVSGNYRDPVLSLFTSLAPATGQMSMSGQSATPGATPVSAAIAEWQGSDAGP
jgi:hypothetical protein